MRGVAGALLLLSLLLPACGGAGGSSGAGTGEGSSRITVANPTGTCVAPDSGARAGYHVTEGDAQWLRDCTLPLKREYWRVFARSAESAYLIPRPDGAAQLTSGCSEPGHALHATVVKYALCASASSTEQVERINALPPADALAVAHELHRALVFVAGDSGFSPYPIPSDILDACALHDTAGDAAFEALCQRERDRLSSGNGLGFSYTGPGAVTLAARLNELYGIE